MDEGRMGFSQDEHVSSFKSRPKKLKSPTKEPRDGILKVPDLGTPRGHHYG
jgi:hypothetical protein